MKHSVEDSKATRKTSALHWRCPPPAAGGPHSVPTCLCLSPGRRPTHTCWGRQHQDTGRPGAQAGQGDQEGTCPSCAWSSACHASSTHLSDQHPIPGLLCHFGLICSLSLLFSPHDWLPGIQPFWHGGHWAQSAPCLSCGLRSNPGGTERLSHLSVVTLQVLAIKLDL